MTLLAGSKLGPYEILAPLGAGGMGEVYRARDPRLGRDVAIKVLPASFSSDPERLHRFEQEARSASALNHPGIVTIYEIGQANSFSYIAMELVQGRTLREVIAEGAIPTKRLLSLAAQFADALARAHEARIVHRDLKPENLMVTRDGFVKILDFGLAKLALPESGEFSNLPTLAKPETVPGVVLGTVGYMSPEQASGKSVDFQSDQFSLGSILYEMATGRRAFSRGTTAESLAAIIREEPEPVESLAPASPVALRWVIERCLAKDPEERYASTRDLARDLAHLRDHLSEVSGQTAPSLVGPRKRWTVPVLMITTLAAIAVAVWSALSHKPQPSGRAVKFAVPIPAGTTYAPGEVSRGFSVSPDGTRLVIEAFSKGRRHLYVRRLDAEEAVELEGSVDATAPFWSQDSRFIAFYADGKLKKVPAEGGRPEELCDALLPFIGTWSSSGTILFTRLDPPGIFRVSDRGGKATRIVSPLVSSTAPPIWPYFLPDGRRFLYLGEREGRVYRGEREVRGDEGGGLRLAALDSSEERFIAPMQSRFEYAAPGFILYVRESALFAQSFDVREMKLLDEPRLLVPNVHYFYGPRHAAFSASQTGVLAYQIAKRPSRLAWFGRDGKEAGQLSEPSVVGGLRISPDGSRAAVDVENPTTGTSDIWVFELAGGVSTRLHSDPVDEIMPVWSADGSRVLYRSDRRGPPDIYEIGVGGPGSEKPVLELPGVQQPEDISRDGKLLAYLEGVTTTNIWMFPLDGQRKPWVWAPTRFSQSSARFSPDGRWLAYESDETGDPEVYVALTDGAGEKRRISPAGGRLPRWRRDGKELFYIATGNSVMAVAVSSGSGWQSATPSMLFRKDNEIENWDVAPDGSRFLIRAPLEKVRESPLRVIVNWPALLKSESRND
ncbi:MAG TPA: protein kinase [Thermoanaerobaculia bacterium]